MSKQNVQVALDYEIVSQHWLLLQALSLHVSTTTSNMLFASKMQHETAGIMSPSYPPSPSKVISETARGFLKLLAAHDFVRTKLCGSI